MPIADRIKQFLLPALNRKIIWRMASVALLSAVFFSWVCIPMRIDGRSMAPTFSNHQFLFCWKPSVWFAGPDPRDVVFVKMAGSRIVLLKRVVAKAGDTVSFKDGRLLVNGRMADEPYVKHRNRWNLPRRTVKAGHVYVVGDNRSVPMASHVFGQVAVDRILGVPLAW